MRKSDAAAPDATVDEEPKLVPVPGLRQDPNDRDLALAYYNMLANGDSAFAERARPLLQAAQKADPLDSDVLVALGFLAQVQGDRTSASQFYEMTLQQDPNNYTAAMNLAVLIARAGRLQAATDIWQKTFARNEDITELGMNLAAADCLLGDKQAAVTALKRVLVYSPDHQAAHQELSSIESGQQPCVVK